MNEIFKNQNLDFFNFSWSNFFQRKSFCFFFGREIYFSDSSPDFGKPQKFHDFVFSKDLLGFNGLENSEREFVPKKNSLFQIEKKFFLISSKVSFFFVLKKVFSLKFISSGNEISNLNPNFSIPKPVARR